MSQEDALAKQEDGGEIAQKKPKAIHLDVREVRPEKASVALSNALQHFHLAREVIDTIAAAPPTTEFVLDLSGVQKGLDTGELKLMRRKTGEVLCAVTRKAEDSNKQVIARRLNAFERAVPSVDPAQRLESISADLANIAIQQQMAEISAELKDVVDGMRRIEQGQWADRYALIDAAESELRDIPAMDSEANQLEAIRSARRYLKEGTASISRAMKQRMDSVESVPERRYQIAFKMLSTPKSYYEETCDWFNFADECFEMLDKAYTLLCLCAIAMGEPNVLETTLGEYRDRLKAMGPDKLLSVGNINPEVDFSGEWFADADAYIEGKRSEAKLLAEGEHIEVIVTGAMLLEAIDDEAGEEGDGGECEPVREDE